MSVSAPQWKHQSGEFVGSRFWDELRKRDGDAVRLCESLRTFVENARAVLSTMVRRMPQFTLHDETHILNVLGRMEELVPDNVLKQLAPLEIGLCIFAAYAHDLGMALSENEKHKLDDPSTPEGARYARHRDGFGEQIRQIERWQLIAESDSDRAAEANSCIEAMEGRILEDYLRVGETLRRMDRQRLEYRDIRAVEGGDGRSPLGRWRASGRKNG